MCHTSKLYATCEECLYHLLILGQRVLLEYVQYYNAARHRSRLQSSSVLTASLAVLYQLVPYCQVLTHDGYLDCRSDYRPLSVHEDASSAPLLIGHRSGRKPPGFTSQFAGSADFLDCPGCPQLRRMRFFDHTGCDHDTADIYRNELGAPTADANSCCLINVLIDQLS